MIPRALTGKGAALPQYQGNPTGDGEGSGFPGWPNRAEGLGLLAGTLALAGWYLASSLLFALAAGIVCFTVLVRFPLVGAVLVVWTAPWFRFPKVFDAATLGWIALGRSAAVEVSLAEFTIVATFAAWLLRSWWDGRNPPPSFEPGRAGTLSLAWWRETLISPLGLLLAAATLSLAWSEFLRFSLREYRTVVLEPALFALVVRDIARERRAWWLLMWSLLALGAGAATLALVSYLTQAETVVAEGVRRASAIYDSPNHLGLLLGRVAPVAAALALFAPLKTRYWTVLVVALMVMVAALTLTYSRGAWLGLTASLAFLAAAQGRRASALLALAGAAAAVAALALVPLERLASAATTSQRLYLWQATVDMLADHPLTGVGLDNFLYHYPRYMRPEAWREPDLSHPHNLILDFWVRLGILGVAVLGWMQARFWFKARQAWQRWSRDAWSRAGALAVMAGMVDFVAHGLIDHSFFLIDMAVIFWLMVMLMDGLVRHDAATAILPDKGR